MTIEEKLKLVAAEKQKINKDYGDGTVVSLKDAPKQVDAISTGSLGLDIALGIGGLPRGRIVEVYGKESCGKTTLSIHTMVEAQKKDGLCAVIDAEQSFDGFYAESLGLNLDRLELNQPDYGDQGLEIADRMISTGAFDVVLIDSVAALVPKSEIEREMGESAMGKHAQLMSQACRKLTPIVKKTNTLVIFINQLREKIGVTYGNPDVTTGGNALKFYSSVRLEVTRSTTKDNSVFEGDLVSGNLTKVKVIKSKVSPPFRTCEFNILYGKGIDKINELIKVASDLEIIKKWGKIITYDGNKYDIEVFNQMLEDTPDFYLSLRKSVLNKVGVKDNTL